MDSNPLLIISSASFRNSTAVQLSVTLSVSSVSSDTKYVLLVIIIFDIEIVKDAGLPMPLKLTTIPGCACRNSLLYRFRYSHFKLFDFHMSPHNAYIYCNEFRFRYILLILRYLSLSRCTGLVTISLDLSIQTSGNIQSTQLLTVNASATSPASKSANIFLSTMSPISAFSIITLNWSLISSSDTLT
jgi:hypothetical protein